MNKFTKEFKKEAIKLKEQGTQPNKIFTNAGIDISGKQNDYAVKLISEWKSNNKKQKPNRFTKEEFNTLKKAKKSEEIKRVEYLEAKVAYLEAENSFLVGLPKKKGN